MIASLPAITSSLNTCVIRIKTIKKDPHISITVTDRKMDSAVYDNIG